MSKQVYISADYAPNDGDQEVIDELHTWGVITSTRQILSIQPKSLQEVCPMMKIVVLVI